MDPRIGKTLDARYVVGRRIGKGGMGAVYEAEHLGLDRKVAIKFLAHHGLSSTERERFRREARLASRVVHENVSQVYDIGASEGDDFIVMEFVEGRDLGRVIKEDGPLEVGRAVQITRDLLAGLHAVHAEGIVHRDVKPTNVMLTMRDGRECVKLVDFGIARAIDERTLTVAGYVVGTAEFMAPEQVRGATVDHRADLYAVGITLYAMLTAELPFSGATAGVGAKQVFEQAPSLDSKRSGLPPMLVAAVERVMAKSPDDRFADAKAFSAALAATTPAAEPTTRSASTVDVRRPREPAPPRQRWPWLVLAALVVVAGIIGVVAARRGGAPPVPVVAEIRADAAVAPAVVADAPAVVVVAPDAAVVEVIDAAVVASSPSRPKEGSAKATGTSRCRCIARDGRDNVGLCPRQGQPLCRCDEANKKSVCPVPWEHCPPAQKFDDKTGRRLDEICDANWMRCPDLEWNQYAKPGTHGAACEGFRLVRTIDPTSIAVKGTLVCDSCPGVNTRAFRGVEGDPCTGFWSRTGESLEGTLRHCEN